MKKQMLKLTMLLLAIVFGGSSALAQTVIFERKDKSAWTEEDATGTGAVKNSDGLFLSCQSEGKKAEKFSAKKDFEFTSGSKVTLVAEIKMGNDCGNATSYDYFTFGGLSLKVYRKKEAQWKFSGDKHKSLQVYTERTFHLRYPLVML